MRIFGSSRAKAAAIAGGALVLAGGGTAAALAATSGTSATPTPTAGAPAQNPPPASSNASNKAAGKGHRGGLLDRSDHATLEVQQGGQWVTLTLDTGKVATDSSTEVTLARPDGQSATIALAPSTKYSGGLTSASSLQPGADVTVTSQSGTALSVSAHTSKAAHGKAAAGPATAPTTAVPGS